MQAKEGNTFQQLSAIVRTSNTHTAHGY